MRAAFGALAVVILSWPVLSQEADLRCAVTYQINDGPRISTDDLRVQIFYQERSVLLTSSTVPMVTPLFMGGIHDLGPTSMTFYSNKSQPSSPHLRTVGGMISRTTGDIAVTLSEDHLTAAAMIISGRCVPMRAQF